MDRFRIAPSACVAAPRLALRLIPIALALLAAGCNCCL
jgi:hypothetical protein